MLPTDYIAIWFVMLLLAAILGLIPASIAKGKGYSFGLWWFYGWMLFIVAIIHAIVIPEKEAQTQSVSQAPSTQSTADEILKFKELLDAGVITQEEFEEKKKKLLNL